MHTKIEINSVKENFEMRGYNDYRPVVLETHASSSKHITVRIDDKICIIPILELKKAVEFF